VSRSTFADVTPLDSLAPYIRQRIEDGDLLVISKTRAYSTVHRRARMDYVGVRKVSPDGRITGEARLIGLFTSKAYMSRRRRRRCSTTSWSRSSRRRT
jgi:glutamate dehydrogenase